MTTPLDVINAQIAALEAQKSALLADAHARWPQRVSLPAAVSLHSAWGAGKQLGLTGEALQRCAHADVFAVEYVIYPTGRRVRLVCEGAVVEPGDVAPEERTPHDHPTRRP